MICKRTSPLLITIIILSFFLTACFLFRERDWEFRIVGGRSNSTSIQVTYDSPEVRKLGTNGNITEDMLDMPGFTVPIKSYCRIIQRSTSKCGPTPEATAVYVLISLTSGPSRGKQGWVCQTYVHQLFP